MRVTLLHNPKAGEGDYSAAKLRDLLTRAGHETTYRSTKEEGFEVALDLPADLVLAAGGDGTVGKVARRLVGRDLPLGVLALGTANNLARTLGFHGSPEEVIPHLAKGTRRGFDVGVVCGPWGDSYFFEGVGGGLFADYLREGVEMTKKEVDGQELSRSEETTEHVEVLRRLLAQYRAQDWHVALDGTDRSDRYLLWEAMNIRSVGPVLTLAPGAETDDGFFDFLGLRESERGLLDEYLKARLTTSDVEFPIPAQRFRHLQIASDRGMVHYDDERWPEKAEERSECCELELTLRPSALTVLLPH